HLITDAEGKDLITGEYHSALLSRVRSSWGVPHHVGQNLIVARPSPDGRYRLIVVAPQPFDISSSFPYYLLILAAIALLCWVLAVRSEERRVGKECRGRWSRDHVKTEIGLQVTRS